MADEPIPQGEPQGEPAGPGEPAARPEWCPEKFYDADKGGVQSEAMAKAHTDTQARLTQVSQELAETKKNSGEPNDDPNSSENPLVIEQDGEGNDQDGEIPKDVTPRQVLELAGLDPAEVAKQFATERTLTDDQFGNIEKILPGIPRSIILHNLERDAQLGELQGREFNRIGVEVVGSQSKLDNLREWARDNLTKEQKEAYHKELENIDTAPDAVRGLLAKHQAAVGAGNAQALIDGDGGNNVTDSQAFKSQAEMRSAMGDSRYNPNSHDFDQEFADNVRNKLRNTEVGRLPER